jgi:hypothetical protein
VGARDTTAAPLPRLSRDGIKLIDSPSTPAISTAGKVFYVAREAQAAGWLNKPGARFLQVLFGPRRMVRLP